MGVGEVLPAPLRKGNGPVPVGAFAVVTVMPCGSPFVSTAMRHLMPDTFFPASQPFSSAVSVFFTLRASTMTKLVDMFLPWELRSPPTIFFSACPSVLGRPSVLSLHIRKYQYIVLPAGKSDGTIRHRHPLFSTYRTPQNASYGSIFLGLVFFLTDSRRWGMFCACPHFTACAWPKDTKQAPRTCGCIHFARCRDVGCRDMMGLPCIGRAKKFLSATRTSS